MPQVTVYIRQEDLAAWQAIDRKSEWMHQNLNGQKFEPVSKLAPATPRPVTKPPTSRFIPYCKHGQIKGECLAKDNGDCNR